MKNPTHKSTHIAKSHKPPHKPKLGKECAFTDPGRNSFFFSFPSEKIKTPDTQTNPTKIVKLSNDNSLQTQWTRTPAGNSTYPKVAIQWLNQALCFYQSFCLVDSEVLRNRHLRVAAKRQTV